MFIVVVIIVIVVLDVAIVDSTVIVIMVSVIVVVLSLAFVRDGKTVDRLRTLTVTEENTQFSQCKLIFTFPFVNICLNIDSRKRVCVRVIVQHKFLFKPLK